MKKQLWIFPIIILITAVVAGIFADDIFSYVSNSFLRYKSIFWATAFGWSTFLALYAFQLHNRFHADNPDDVSKGYGKLRWSQRIHQFVLNFSGGIIGFAIMYLFLYTNIFSSFEGWKR